MTLTKIGRYQIIEELGRGGMATVYLAHDPYFERDVAIKLLPHEMLHHPTYRSRFEQEAKIVATLDIPAIVPVYDYGEDNGQLYLVMRYMAGGTLADRLQKKICPLAETARIIDILAPALDEAHAQNIIHRDLKPSNILFDHQDNPFISDFGTALITQIPEKLTETGGFVGTLAYMSPEHIRGEPLDGRTDLYALGIIAFEALNGKHPYQTDTASSSSIGMAIKHITNPVPRILDTQPHLPQQCQTVISRALAKDRKDRFPTAVAFAQALKATTAVPTPISASSQPGKRPSIQWRRLSWVIPALLAVALFIIGGTFHWFGDAAAAPDLTAVPETSTAVPHTPKFSATSSSTSIPTVRVTAVTEATALATTAPIVIATPIAVAAPQSASLFAQPNINSPELAIIQTNEAITITGRSENGNWLYVSNKNQITGFVSASYLMWEGEISTLPVIAQTPTLLGICHQDCPLLEIDAYPTTGGRCEGGTIYRTVYLRGQGGSDVYTYFWNDKQITGPLKNKGFGFEVNNLNDPVIGTAKVTSSDGQTAEKELYISDFSCD